MIVDIPVIRRVARALLPALLAAPLLCPAAHAQIHPPEVRAVYPLGGSAGLTTRVTIFGTSFRNARQIVFDEPGIAAKIVAPDFAKLPPPTLDDDNAPFVVADFTVDRTAARDVFRFRVISDAGVSSAGKWMVGREIPQIEEKEPNNGAAQAQSVTLPLSVNGHIGDGGDVDTYAVDLEAGKAFVAEVVAARSGSPLDSLLTMVDADGAQVAGNDDFGGPDSLIVYTPKKAGRYFVSISSSVGAGSPGHSYRLSMGVLPLLTGVVPATVQRGKTSTVSAVGVNVPATIPVTVPADWSREFAPVYSQEGATSNSVRVGVSDLPRVTTGPANVDPAHALEVPAPGAADGRFFREGKPGDAPFYYKFHADAGSRFTIDVQCQDRSGARCDPLLTLYNGAGALLEESDDSAGRDSHLDRAFTKSDTYVFRVKNLAGTTGPDLVYQVLIQRPPLPGFSLAADTGDRGVGRGGSAALDVQVTRDRWSGPVTLTAVDLPTGVTASSVTVPDGVGRGLVVLTAAADAPLTGFPLHITGTGIVAGKTETRTLTLATDRIWNGGAMSLQPSPPGLLYFAVTAPFEIAVKAASTAVEVTAGQAVKLHAMFERRAGFDKPFTLNVIGLPEGVTAGALPVQPGTMEADIEIRTLANARPGAYTIVLDAVIANSPQVMLDRVSQPVTLTVRPVKTAEATGAGSRRTAL